MHCPERAVNQIVELRAQEKLYEQHIQNIQSARPSIDISHPAKVLHIEKAQKLAKKSRELAMKKGDRLYAKIPKHPDHETDSDQNQNNIKKKINSIKYQNLSVAEDYAITTRKNWMEEIKQTAIYGDLNKKANDFDINTIKNQQNSSPSKSKNSYRYRYFNNNCVYCFNATKNNDDDDKEKEEFEQKYPDPELISTDSFFYNTDSDQAKDEIDIEKEYDSDEQLIKELVNKRCERLKANDPNYAERKKIDKKYMKFNSHYRHENKSPTKSVTINHNLQNSQDGSSKTSNEFVFQNDDFYKFTSPPVLSIPKTKTKNNRIMSNKTDMIDINIEEEEEVDDESDKENKNNINQNAYKAKGNRFQLPQLNISGNVEKSDIEKGKFFSPQNQSLNNEDDLFRKMISVSQNIKVDNENKNEKKDDISQPNQLITNSPDLSIISSPIFTQEPKEELPSLNSNNTSTKIPQTPKETDQNQSDLSSNTLSPQSPITIGSPMNLNPMKIFPDYQSPENNLNHQQTSDSSMNDNKSEVDFFTPIRRNIDLLISLGNQNDQKEKKRKNEKSEQAENKIVLNTKTYDIFLNKNQQNKVISNNKDELQKENEPNEKEKPKNEIESNENEKKKNENENVSSEKEKLQNGISSVEKEKQQNGIESNENDKQQNEITSNEKEKQKSENFFDLIYSINQQKEQPKENLTNENENRPINFLTKLNNNQPNDNLLKANKNQPISTNLNISNDQNQKINHLPKNTSIHKDSSISESFSQLFLSSSSMQNEKQINHQEQPQLNQQISIDENMQQLNQEQIPNQQQMQTETKEKDQDFVKQQEPLSPSQLNTQSSITFKEQHRHHHRHHHRSSKIDSPISPSSRSRSRYEIEALQRLPTGELYSKTDKIEKPIKTVDENGNKLPHEQTLSVRPHSPKKHISVPDKIPKQQEVTRNLKIPQIENKDDYKVPYGFVEVKDEERESYIAKRITKKRKRFKKKKGVPPILEYKELKIENIKYKIYSKGENSQSKNNEMQMNSLNKTNDFSHIKEKKKNNKIFLRDILLFDNKEIDPNILEEELKRELQSDISTEPIQNIENEKINDENKNQIIKNNDNKEEIKKSNDNEIINDSDAKNSDSIDYTSIKKAFSLTTPSKAANESQHHDKNEKQMSQIIQNQIKQLVADVKNENPNNELSQASSQNKSTKNEQFEEEKEENSVIKNDNEEEEKEINIEKNSARSNNESKSENEYNYFSSNESKKEISSHSKAEIEENQTNKYDEKIIIEEEEDISENINSQSIIDSEKSVPLDDINNSKGDSEKHTSNNNKNESIEDNNNKEKIENTNEKSVNNKNEDDKKETSESVENSENETKDKIKNENSSNIEEESHHENNDIQINSQNDSSKSANDQNNINTNDIKMNELNNENEDKHLIENNEENAENEDKLSSDKNESNENANKDLSNESIDENKIDDDKSVKNLNSSEKNEDTKNVSENNDDENKNKKDKSDVDENKKIENDENDTSEKLCKRNNVNKNSEVETKSNASENNNDENKSDLDTKETSDIKDKNEIKDALKVKSDTNKSSDNKVKNDSKDDDVKSNASESNNNENKSDSDTKENINKINNNIQSKSDVNKDNDNEIKSNANEEIDNKNNCSNENKIDLSENSNKKKDKSDVKDKTKAISIKKNENESDNSINEINSNKNESNEHNEAESNEDNDNKDENIDIQQSQNSNNDSKNENEDSNDNKSSNSLKGREYIEEEEEESSEIDSNSKLTKADSNDKEQITNSDKNENVTKSETEEDNENAKSSEEEDKESKANVTDNENRDSYSTKNSTENQYEKSTNEETDTQNKSKESTEIESSTEQNSNEDEDHQQIISQIARNLLNETKTESSKELSNENTKSNKTKSDASSQSSKRKHKKQENKIKASSEDQKESPNTNSTEIRQTSNNKDQNETQSERSDEEYTKSNQTESNFEEDEEEYYNSYYYEESDLNKPTQYGRLTESISESMKSNKEKENVNINQDIISSPVYTNSCIYGEDEKASSEISKEETFHFENDQNQKIVNKNNQNQTNQTKKTKIIPPPKATLKVLSQSPSSPKSITVSAVSSSPLPKKVKKGKHHKSDKNQEAEKKTNLAITTNMFTVSLSPKVQTENQISIPSNSEKKNKLSVQYFPLPIDSNERNSTKNQDDNKVDDIPLVPLDENDLDPIDDEIYTTSNKKQHLFVLQNNLSDNITIPPNTTDENHDEQSTNTEITNDQNESINAPSLSSSPSLKPSTPKYQSPRKSKSKTKKKVSVDEDGIEIIGNSPLRQGHGKLEEITERFLKAKVVSPDSKNNNSTVGNSLAPTPRKVDIANLIYQHEALDDELSPVANFTALAQMSHMNRILRSSTPKRIRNHNQEQISPLASPKSERKSRTPKRGNERKSPGGNTTIRFIQ